MPSIKIRTLTEELGLIPHPEGGFYKETYRSNELVSTLELPERYTGNRCFATAIYFLLVKNSFSAFHRIKSDETWHFYEGNPIEIITISDEGKLEKQLLGTNWKNNEVPQFTIPSETWFASRVYNGGEYGLAGCTVYPGFEFSDFEMAERKALQEKFPLHTSIIQELTRE